MSTLSSRISCLFRFLQCTRLASMPIRSTHEGTALLYLHLSSRLCTHTELLPHKRYPAEISIFLPVILLVPSSITTVSAQSSNSASLPNAFDDMVSDNCLSENDFDQSVFKTPGETQFTAISGLQAFANEVVRWIAADFDTAVDQSQNE